MDHTYHYLLSIARWCQQLTIHQLLLLAGVTTIVVWIVLVLPGRQHA